jgi:hypothetical protein
MTSNNFLNSAMEIEKKREKNTWTGKKGTKIKPFLIT